MVNPDLPAAGLHHCEWINSAISRRYRLYRPLGHTWKTPGRLTSKLEGSRPVLKVSLTWRRLLHVLAGRLARVE